MDEEPKIKGKEEIAEALKEFETKSAESYKAVKFYNETDTPKIVKLVMKLSGGAIREQKIAEYVLFGFVLVAIFVSLFLFFGIGGTNKAKIEAPPGQKVIYPENAPPLLESKF